MQDFFGPDFKITNCNFNFFRIFFSPGAEIKAGRTDCRYLPVGDGIIRRFAPVGGTEGSCFSGYFPGVCEILSVISADRLAFVVKMLIFECFYRFRKLSLIIFDYIILPPVACLYAVVYPTLLLFNLNKLL